MKYTRQKKILEIIENKEIETQEELSDELKKLGLNVIPRLRYPGISRNSG